MKKNFKNGFDDLLNGNLLKKEYTTPTDSTTVSKESESSHTNDHDDEYTRIAIAIKTQNLINLKLNCILNKTKIRDVINSLIQEYLEKHKK